MLTKTKENLSDLDVEYPTTKYNDLVNVLKADIIENFKEPRIKISLVDRLRYIHCLVRDGVKELYLKSQNSMLRTELDSRNSSSRDPNFHEKMISVFNDVSFVLESICFGDLHKDFSTTLELKLSSYSLTIDKSKEILTSIKPMIVDLITRYEQSGMGAGNRDLTADDWGMFDISLCEDGDDRKCFVRLESHSYLLYWWNMLEQEDLLHFSCVKLPNETTANSRNFSLVSNVRSPSTRRQQTSPELKANLSSNLELIGDGVNSLAEITREREIEVWQEKKI